MSDKTAGHDLHINEVASYLYSHDVPLRTQLLNDPEVDPGILDPGEEMGEAEGIQVNRKVLMAQCKVIAASLESAQTKAQARTQLLQNKIVSLRRLRFITALASAVTAGVTSVSALLENMATTVVASFATLLGTVANAGAATFVLGQSGTEPEILSLIQDLEEARAFSEVSSKYLVAVASGDYPVEEATVLVSEANIYFGKLVSALQRSAKYVPGAVEEARAVGGATVTTAKA